ncbi:phage major capsid protein [Phenylobacterium soli]|uniref:Phage major capsid protein n=1 Tax=Phenylobacterium soli TaxID=2170551 RepID=A0A328ACT8_9CAUL|nr:phage major capsid protein [Phenylobacterium soli]RAK51204.1 phage major capsid protein [Phenylobacterium soli]
MASPGLDEIVTTTLRNRSGVVADNMSKNNALLYRLNKRGRVKPVSGGRTIVRELSYAENSTFQRYSGYEILNTSPSDVLSAAEFSWKQASVAVTMSGLEQYQNSGEDAVLDLLENRIEVAEKTMENNLSQDMYSDGTASSGKQIGGLQLLVADAPTTGTVGGINRATYTFWRNQKYQATTDGGSAASSANIQKYMNALYQSCSRQTDRPDLIIADTNYYNFYLQSLQAIQRITSDEMAQAGFQTLKYMGADVVFDGGIGGGCPTNHMYMLNTSYVFWQPHRDRNMVPLDQVNSINQDAMVKLIIWMGNMTLSNAELQGVLFQT